MLKKYNQYILFFSPILLKLIVIFFFVTDTLFVLSDIVEDIIFSFLILFILLNISKKYSSIQYILLGIYILYFILEICSLLIVESNFSASFMYALLDSSRPELLDFFGSYFRIKNVIVILLLLLIYVLLVKSEFKVSNKISFFLKVLVSLLCVLFLKFTGYIENNTYYNIVRGSYGYYQLNSTVKSTTIINSNEVSTTLNNEVFVVIIGESIARKHLQLYDYNRATSPLLYNFKDSLMVYDNVIAPDVLTTKVLPKLLTTISNNDSIEQPTNIIDVLNEANFDTYWISNQRPIGFHENVVSQLVSVSKEVKYLTHKSHIENSNLDKIVLPELKNVLNKKGKKVVFVHLIGAHFNYNNRYPTDFNKFNPNTGNNNQDLINQYDNAILYNDFIVYSILKQVQSLKQKSSVLYLSDHGEDVFDESSFAGHTESKITKSMLEIPFALWISDDYDLPEDFQFEPQRKFMTDYFYSSLGHLLGVSYPSILKSRSIFSNAYKERERIILDGFNYDLKTNE